MTDEAGPEAPERTCVACRRKGTPDDLLRVVLSPDGRPAVDFRGGLPGRGAWLCWSPACMGAKGLSGRVAHTLRAPGLVLPAGFPEQAVRAFVVARLTERLGLLARSGGARPGHDVAGTAVDRGEAAFVLLAADTSEGTGRRVESHARAAGAEVVKLPLDRGQVGAAMGRGPVAVVAVATSPLARRLRKELQTWSDFL